MGEFDSGATNLDIGGIDFHGAHPQFNLLEGNVVTEINEDSVWGTSSQTTAYRNWVVGTNRICSPMSGRGAVNCSGANGHYGFQAARAIETSYLGTANSFVGERVGLAQMQSLKGYNHPLAQRESVEYPAPAKLRCGCLWMVFWIWQDTATMAREQAVLEAGFRLAIFRETPSTDFFHGNFSNIGGSIAVGSWGYA